MSLEFLSELNPTEGHILGGVELDPHRILARVRIPQLRQIAPDPRDSEDKKKLASLKSAQELREIREDVQRLFEGAKAKNVGPYADYIVELFGGQDGITPPIILYSEQPLQVATDDKWGFGAVLVPWGAQLVAIDGETQLAARYEAANKDPQTEESYLAVYICHGFTKNWARQAFHDLNVLGVRPNAAVSIGMDARDPLTGIARQVEKRVPFFKDRVNKVRRQLRGADTDVVTIASLRGACITFAEGIGGIRYGARPVALPEDRQPVVLERATEWFEAVTDAIGPAMEDRENKLASAPSVLAAVGAVGHELLHADDPQQRAKMRDELIERLRQVDWRRGKQWEGIAGKFTPKGAFSIGGSKETAYAIYGALTDDTSPAFAQVRPSLAAAA